MTKTSAEFESEFMRTAEKKTGRTVEQWLPIIKDAGFSSQPEITEWLKTEYKFNHLQASLLSGIYLNNGLPVYLHESSLIDSQFLNCEDMRPLFNEVSKKILSKFLNAQLVPKKSYLSYSAIREFATINIRSNEICIGMDLGDMAFSEFVQKSKLIGPLQRISHMRVITRIQDFDQELIGYLQLSYNRSHQRRFFSFLL